MTILNTNLGGADPSDGDVLNAADWKATFDATVVFGLKRIKLNRFGLDTNASNILPFSSTVWQSGTKDTADGGATSSGSGFGGGGAAVSTNLNVTVGSSSAGNSAGFKTSTVNAEPPYMDVVWVIKIK